MNDIQFAFLFIGICINALALIKLGYANKVAIAELKKDIHYIKKYIGMCRNGHNQPE